MAAHFFLVAGVGAAILIGFTLLFSVMFVYVLRFWLTAPARLVPYFERRLDVKTWGAFKRGFPLAQGFEVLVSNSAPVRRLFLLPNTEAPLQLAESCHQFWKRPFGEGSHKSQ